jgi:hypothetical protein
MATIGITNAANTCVLSSCNSINCPNGCANCAKATQWSIPNNGVPIEVCPNNGSFCFTGSMTNNRCTISNCDGCSNGDPSSCTGCQAITSNTSNKDWCLNGNCYHMSYSSAASGSSSSSASQGSGAGTSNSDASTPGQSSNCELLQCNAGDCPNGCDGCSKASTVAVADGNISQFCPSNGSFCFIATSAGGVCAVSSCASCGNTPDTCTNCQAVTAQNSISNFCSNSQCYHMAYTAYLGSSVGASSSNSSNNHTNITITNGIGSGTNGTLSTGTILNSGLSIQVSSLLLAVVAGGLLVLF